MQDKFGVDDQDVDTRQSCSLVEQLPVELRELIAQNLPVKDLLKFRVSSKTLRDVCDDPVLWRILLRRDFDVTAQASDALDIYKKIGEFLSPLAIQKFVAGGLPETKYFEAYKLGQKSLAGNSVFVRFESLVADAVAHTADPDVEDLMIQTVNDIITQIANDILLSRDFHKFKQLDGLTERLDIYHGSPMEFIDELVNAVTSRTILPEYTDEEYEKLVKFISEYDSQLSPKLQEYMTNLFNEALHSRVETLAKQNKWPEVIARYGRFLALLHQRDNSTSGGVSGNKNRLGKDHNLVVSNGA